MLPDAYLNVRFKTSQEGGRNAPILGDFYSCPMFIDEEGFDCRLLVKGMLIELGQWYEVPVVFMNRDLVLSKLNVGKVVTFWEGKTVGVGKILKLPHSGG